MRHLPDFTHEIYQDIHQTRLDDHVFWYCIFQKAFQCLLSITPPRALNVFTLHACLLYNVYATRTKQVMISLFGNDIIPRKINWGYKTHSHYKPDVNVVTAR